MKYFRPRKGTPGSTPPTTATPTSPAPWTRKIFAGSSTTAGTLSSGYISECTRSSKSISPKIFRTTTNQQQKLFTRKIRMAHCFEERKKISELKSKLSLLLLLSTNYIIYINISSNNQCWQKFKKEKWNEEKFEKNKKISQLHN